MKQKIKNKTNRILTSSHVLVNIVTISPSFLSCGVGQKCVFAEYNDVTVKLEFVIIIVMAKNTLCRVHHDF